MPTLNIHYPITSSCHIFLTLHTLPHPATPSYSHTLRHHSPSRSPPCHTNYFTYPATLTTTHHTLPHTTSHTLPRNSPHLHTLPHHHPHLATSLPSPSHPALDLGHGGPLSVTHTVEGHIDHWFAAKVARSSTLRLTIPYLVWVIVEPSGRTDRREL